MVNYSEDPASVGNVLQKMISAQEDLSFEQEEALMTLLKKWVENEVGGQQTLEASDAKLTDVMSLSELYASIYKYAKEKNLVNRADQERIGGI